MKQCIACRLFLLAGCAPDITETPFLVQQPMVLAMIADPPEARPRREVTVTPIFAGNRGPQPLWSASFCVDPAMVGDPRPVSDACVTNIGQPLVVTGATARGFVPADACARFGPNPPPGNFRPRDPDPTGGFYQPIRIEAFGAVFIHLLRITCPLPDAPADVARELQSTYVPNNNPSIASVQMFRADHWQTLGAIRPGELVPLRTAWPSYARENYVWLAPGANALVQRSESLRLSWFVNAGSLSDATTQGAENDSSFDAVVKYRAPTQPGEVSLWVVLHDSRGGTAVVQQALWVR